MDKTANTRYPIHDLLARRWSPRAFSSRKVEADALCRLLEAARWAPSCFNEQPWSFFVASKDQPQQFQQLLDCLVEGNRAWAKNAPVLMLSVAKLQFERNGKPNRHAYHDVGLAMGNLLAEATDLGLAVHQMAGFDVEKARAAFAIPEGQDPVAMIAVGYQGDTDSLPEDLRGREKAERQRKNLEQFVFTGRWGETASLLRER